MATRATRERERKKKKTERGDEEQRKQRPYIATSKTAAHTKKISYPSKYNTDSHDNFWVSSRFTTTAAEKTAT